MNKSNLLKTILSLLLARTVTPVHAADINYTYDVLGRLTQTDYANGASIKHTYDSSGNILATNVTGVPTTDTDKDGMPDAWETYYGLDPNDPKDAVQDLDGDGFNNLDEYKAGTDPNDPNSKPNESTLTPKISAGGLHTCAILSDNTVKCWGNNSQGQLGIGSTINHGIKAGDMGINLPSVDLGVGRTAKALAAGFYHTCAIMDNNAVKCWGANTYGQLGLGDTAHRGDNTGEMGSNLPTVDLGAGRSAKLLTAGDHYTCALLDNNTIKCWGYNANGQLGLGNTAHRGDQANEMGDNLAKIDLGAGRTGKAVTAGSDHVCALLDNNTVKCWGQNSLGQLGLGDMVFRGDQPNEMGENLPPVDLGTGRAAKALIAHSGTNCALLDNDTVKCWGMNNHGQLGLGDTAHLGDQMNEMGNNLLPIELGTGHIAQKLVAGGFHRCAILDDNTVKCWGNNVSGELGLGDKASRGDNPNEMSNNLPLINLGTGRTVKELTAGFAHTCGLLDNNTVKCWGANSSGQLGQSDTAARGDGVGKMGDFLLAVDL